MLDRDKLIVLAASSAAFALGAAGAHYFTSKRLTALFENEVEIEVKKAHDFYSKRAEEEVEKRQDEQADISEEATELQETIEEVTVANPDDSGRETLVQYNKIASTYSPEDKNLIGPKPGETQENYEQRLIDQAKNFVRGVVEDVEPDLVETEEEVVVRENIFDNHGSAEVEALDTSTRTPDHPYVISAEEYEDNETGYSQNMLTYYADDKVLTDEKDGPLNLKVIGEKNLKFGLASGDLNLVYVRNDELEVDFEVAQALSSYAETVLGGRPGKKRS